MSASPLFCPIKRSRAHAFTLIEMLIAVMACSIILAAVHAVFFGAIRLRNVTDAALTDSLPFRQALSIIQRDLANLAAPDGQLSKPIEFTGAGMNGQVSPDFYTTTGTLSANSPWPEIQRVSYLLVESTNAWAGKDLVRSMTRNLLAASEEQPIYQWLLSGVNQLVFQFYDGSQWKGTWDSSTEETPLPKGIRVQIELTSTNRADAPRVLELVAPVMVQSRTNQTAQTESAAQ